MSLAWYHESAEVFRSENPESVVGKLSRTAISQGFHIEEAQGDEWMSSVEVLQQTIPTNKKDSITSLSKALACRELEEINHVILEYDFKRRGIRIDTVLIAPGVIFVVEFKRSRFTSADRDQVLNYCTNLIEFHEETQKLTEGSDVLIIPLLALTHSSTELKCEDHFCDEPWSATLSKPIECQSSELDIALCQGLALRKSKEPISGIKWMKSRFSPSSSILDAAISLWGQHDVTAISQHAAHVDSINSATNAIRNQVIEARSKNVNKVIFLSGSPGAGKTLVGLNLLFSLDLAVFVTGNAPLVEVLQKALKNSYLNQVNVNQLKVPSGYKMNQAKSVVDLSTYSIEKAHRFLKTRGASPNESTETLVIFDEAQRTYKEGRTVANERLPKDEAEMILESYSGDNNLGVTVVCLIGHNQAINTGESGITSWFQAAENQEWEYLIDDETLNLPNLFCDRAEKERWAKHTLRQELPHGHLSHSLRFYRNAGVETWAGFALDADSSKASEVAHQLGSKGVKIHVCRDIEVAKKWVRSKRVGSERSGIIASSAAGRLIGEGVFLMPRENAKIADWMLAPTGDPRSSNMLEFAQSQFQVQGLELDYTIVCWDADLRRQDSGWKSFKVVGANWQKRDTELVYRMNTYRVLLTRARKGMIIFIPKGDESLEDGTRDPNVYNSIFEYLCECGATLIS